MSDFPLNCWLSVALGIVAGTVRTEAHVGDVVYPFTEITDDMLEVLDFTDGSIEDWETVMGEPTLNLLDFTRLEKDWDQGGVVTVPRAPSDLDLRVWLGWHRGTGRLYIGLQASDDVYVGGFEGEKNDYRSNYDSIGLGIDGDHTGGEYWGTSSYHHFDDFKTGSGLRCNSPGPGGFACRFEL